MTYQDNFTVPSEIMEQITRDGIDYFPELLAMLINAAMKLEREQYLKAKPYERSEERQGYANGYKPKSVQTRIGKLELEILQVREGGFYPLPGARCRGRRAAGKYAGLHQRSARAVERISWFVTNS